MQTIALYSGLFGLIYIFLSYRVVGLRKEKNVGVGTGDNEALTRAIRVHANFSEYVPMGLLLLAFFEFNGGSQVLIHAAGIIFIVARLMHAEGLGKSIGVSKGRLIGTLLTWLTIIGLSLANIYQFVSVSMSA